MTACRSARTTPLILAALVLAACGGNAAPGGTAAPGGAVVQVPDNFCALLSAADISQVMGQQYPAPHVDGEQSCTTTNATENTPGGTVSFTLFTAPVECTVGQPASQQCLTMISIMYDTGKQSAKGQVQAISGLGDQAYCAASAGPLPMAWATVLKGWINVQAFTDSCAHSQTLVSMLLPKLGG